MIEIKKYLIMKISREYPPNIETIKARFQLNSRVCFTYGDTIYNPGGGKITDDLMVHEETHMIQQDGQPLWWWAKYIEDDEFRLSQEVEAYANQYQYYKKNRCTKPNGKIRKERLDKFLYKIAKDLSSPIYGGIITVSDAKALIRG